MIIVMTIIVVITIVLIVIVDDNRFLPEKYTIVRAVLTRADNS